MDDRARLVQQSQRLRDYLVRAGGEGDDELTEALHPFERDGSTPTESDHLALISAFRTARRLALATCDDHTLSEVLDGRSPFCPSQSWFYVSRSVVGSAALTIVGVMLVALALHYTYWSNNATYTLSQIDQIEKFDYVDHTTRLVELQRLFEASIVDVNESDLEPFRIYSQSLALLSQHFTDQQDVVQRIQLLQLEIFPFRRQFDARARAFCQANPEAASAPYFVLFKVGCVRAATSATAGTELTQAAGTTESEAAKLAEVGPEQPLQTSAAVVLDPSEDARSTYQTYLEEMRVALVRLMVLAGRKDAENVLPTDPLSASVTGKAEDLSQTLNIVHRWALPIIYGALGSIVYLMWRVLSPPISPFGVFRGLLRTIFAALAALTLSMLLIPSNALALGAEVSRPLIYLISFVFGYSVEAFVSTLNNLNSFVASRLSPRDDAAAKT